jgi:hypothetical protein
MAAVPGWHYLALIFEHRIEEIAAGGVDDADHIVLLLHDLKPLPHLEQ